MFPGYIFARFDPVQAAGVLQAAGVASIVGFGTKYCPVEDAEIEAVRIVLRAGVEVLRESLMRPGTPVRVRYGTLQGLEGLLVEVKNQSRLVITVELLQRSVAVEIDHAMIEPLPARPAIHARSTAA